MRYYVCEQNEIVGGKYNAVSKARSDVESILEEEKIKKFVMPTKYNQKNNKIKKLWQYINNNRIWNKEIKKLNEGSIIFIQYPLNNITYKLNKIIKKYSKKNIKFIAIIHDMNSLRIDRKLVSYREYKRVKNEDKETLKEFTYIISHNAEMSKELIKLDCKPEKIINLEIFDYLVNDTVRDIERNKNMPVIIAGNLSSTKVGYLDKISNISDVKFNLYGKGYDLKASENIEYKGAFLPEELINNLDGGFGLVWDGTTDKTCDGKYGEYLRYNNPHKLSLYIVAQIPIITWENAAISSFVKENKIGICINSLDEISLKIKSISDKEYDEFIKNEKKISEKMQKGYFLKKSIEKIN